MEEESGSGGLTYRYTYGLEKLSVAITGVPNGAGSVMQYTYDDESGEFVLTSEDPGHSVVKNSIVKLWYHQDRLGSVDFLTDNVAGKVTSYITYDQWGAPTAKAVLKMGVRELDLVTQYTVHQYDQVLELYFAQARMYDASNRRFMAEDPVKDGGNWYAYCANNPVAFVDLFGLFVGMTEDVYQMVKESGYIKPSTYEKNHGLLTTENVDAIVSSGAEPKYPDPIVPSVPTPVPVEPKADIRDSLDFTTFMDETSFNSLVMSGAIISSISIYAPTFEIPSIYALINSISPGALAGGILGFLGIIGVTLYPAPYYEYGIDPAIAHNWAGVTYGETVGYDFDDGLDAAVIDSTPFADGGGSASPGGPDKDPRDNNGNNAYSHILSNKSLTNQTGKVDNYVSSSHGYNAAQADFHSLSPSNVKVYPNGTTVGSLPDGTTVNLHPSSSLGGTPTVEIYNPDTGFSIKIRY